MELTFCPNDNSCAPPSVAQIVRLPVMVDHVAVAYVAPFTHLHVELDVCHAVTVLIANARRWTLERHGLFPWAFHQATNQLLLVANRFGIPKEVVHAILGFLAWHYPIAPLELDHLNHELPFPRQLQLHQYLSRVKFPLEEIQEDFQRLREKTVEHEESEAYVDHRQQRSDADKARDAEYNHRQWLARLSSCCCRV